MTILGLRLVTDSSFTPSFSSLSLKTNEVISPVMSVDGARTSIWMRNAGWKVLDPCVWRAVAWNCTRCR